MSSYQQGRFDGDSARHILERAAREQHRLNEQRYDTYSLEELQEMAAEAGISREALHAAIDGSRRHRRAAAVIGLDERPRGLLGFLQKRFPGTWSPATKGTVLACAGVVALAAIVLTVPVAAQVLLWMTIVLAVLLFLGGLPT